MSTKKYEIKPNDSVPACPSCGNNTEFVCRSEQVGEDCCDIWVECICGRPTPSEYRAEDTWGGVGWDEFIWALQPYKESIEALNTPSP